MNYYLWYYKRQRCLHKDIIILCNNVISLFGVDGFYQNKFIQKTNFTPRHSLPYQLRSATMLSVTVHIHQIISLKSFFRYLHNNIDELSRLLRWKWADECRSFPISSGQILIIKSEYITCTYSQSDIISLYLNQRTFQNHTIKLKLTKKERQKQKGEKKVGACSILWTISFDLSN